MPAPNPKLGDPMAEALAEDAANAAKAAQTQAPAPVSELAAETPAESQAAAPAPEPQTSGEPAPAGEPEPAKAKKTPQELLLARVGKLTATQRQTEAQNADLSKQLEAARALLASQAPEGGTAAPASPPGLPPGAAVYTQDQVQELARQMAANQVFNTRANDTYNAGKEKFGDWDETMDGLKMTGLMSSALLEAALETDSPIDVLHALGTDLEAAERIAGLSPIRMGVELARMGAQLSKPVPARISQAPAPVNTVNGHATAEVDLAKLAESEDAGAYVAARKAQGDPWANSRRR